jgi:hypothetical protein
MYSFAQRSDTCVVDEPLYAHYLRASGLPHPGREEVLASQENDGSKVIEWMMKNDFHQPVVFFKQMTHHLVDLSLDFLSGCKNILLIRDPREVLISYSKVIEQPTLDDIGIRQSFELYRFLSQRNFHFTVIDSSSVLKNPGEGLKKLCSHLGLPFQSGMLAWKAGARNEDGVWAKYWYQNVHRSTGFVPLEVEEKFLPENLIAVYEEAKPYFQRLSSHVLF